MIDDGSSPGPGGVLKATRQSLRYTQQDIADALNLGVSVIEDIETEQWHKFHAATFARGYVKAYAKLLDLDADALVRGYEGFRDPEAEAPVPAPLKSRLAASGGGLADALQRQPGAVLSGAVTAAVAVIAIVLFLVWPEADEDADARVKNPAPALTMTPPPRRGEPRAPVATNASEPIDRPAASAAVEAVPVVADEPIPAPSKLRPNDMEERAAAEDTVEEVVLEDVDLEAEDEVEAVPVLHMAQTSAQAPPAALPPRRITPLGDDRLDMSFTDDCWVEIKDDSGRNLYSDLSRAGDVLALVGRGPFRVLLGYSPGVTMSWNGRPVELARHSRNNVASLVIGG